MLLRYAIAALALIVTPMMAAAEVELSFYTGAQESPHSRVSGTDPGNAVNSTLDFTAGWEGKSFDPPPYYGLRATWWRNGNFGFGAELTHAKIYADPDTLTNNGFSRLEFTDGINILTANAMYRWPDRWGNFTPYVGGGIGLSIPNVEVVSAGGSTKEYQITGPAVRWIAGASYAINDRWSVFGEYQGTYSMNDAKLENGGTLSTDIITNAVNVGVAFSF